MLGHTKQFTLLACFLLTGVAGYQAVWGVAHATAHSVDVCDERNLWCDKVKKLVQKTCQAKGIEIKKEGGIEAAEIDRRMLVDRHYYSIASKAALKKPTELNIPMDKFKDFFRRRLGRGRRGWQGFNVKDVCENFKSTQTR